MIQSTNKTKNTGFNYNEGGLINRFVSSRLYMNPRIEAFLNLIGPAFIEFTESVKKIQFYSNFTIDKNDRRINI